MVDYVYEAKLGFSSVAGFQGYLDHHEKADVIRQYAKEYNLDVFVETGTYRGEMIEHVRNDFRKIYSIELGAEHVKHARKRFHYYGHVNIFQGDSAVMLDAVSRMIDEPALYFLDAHYSGGDTYRTNPDSRTPVWEEMEQIIERHERGEFNHESVILIDDAKDFDESNQHPPLKDFLRMALDGLHGYWFELKGNIIRITPKREK